MSMQERVQCPECFSIGSHLFECGSAPTGLGIGQRRKRDHAENARWKQIKKRVFERDGHCRYPNCAAIRGLHPHHIELVQQVFGRGAGWAEADTMRNVITVCYVHHDEIHSAAGHDDAIRHGLLKPADNPLPDYPERTKQ